MTAPVMLIVLDGFGIGDDGPADATRMAHTPFLDRARLTYPTAQLETSGKAVGLPPGQMGNSEVGHMTMGAGRIIVQDMTRITAALSAGELDTNEPYQTTLEGVERSGGTLHLMGLVSDGGVHSHIDHLVTLMENARTRGIPTAVHAFLDGRDTPPDSGLGFIREIAGHADRTGARIATVIGRYYAMDRDNRWERIQLAYEAIVCREGIAADGAVAAVEAAYARGETDEFVTPILIEGGAPLADGDGVVFFNFRADRARQLTNAITGRRASLFDAQLERKKVVTLSGFTCFAEYDAGFGLPVAFPRKQPERILGEIVSEAGLPQLRIAETEKYAHVTFFFNGGLETPFPNEDRVLIPSPRDVATYDHKPEMSAHEVTNALLAHLPDRDYAFILLNFANPDMVGHTGVLDAAVKAVETIDAELERIAEAVLARGGTVLITADHGNCELMIDPETGAAHTAHTTNPVPLLWLSPDTRGRRLRDGGLSDLAPTVLQLMGLPIPDEMTGGTLIVDA